MRFLMVGLVGLVLGCGDRDRSVPAGPAAKVSADCSLFEILSGKEGCAEDPSLDEVPEDYEAPSDSTMAAVTDTTETETVDADSTGAVDPEPVVADTTETVTAEPVSATDTFDIEVVFLPPSDGARDFTDHEKQLVLKAARRWEEKFLHGIPAAYLSEVDAGADVLLENEWRVRLPTVIDDIHIFVALGGSLEVVRYLVEQGADVDAADHRGRMAWVVAARAEVMYYLESVMGW